MKDKVRQGYKEGNYDEKYRRTYLKDFEENLFNKLIKEMSDNPDVLDLGCGTGLPFDKFLVENDCNVIGVDFVEKHLKKARKNIPNGSFLKADFTEISFDNNTFDGIISLYAIFHIPRSEHRKLLEKMKNMLRNDGMILITMGAEEMDKYKDEFADTEMIWSSFSLDKNIEIVKEAGFKIIETYEQEDTENHLWILGKKIDNV